MDREGNTALHRLVRSSQTQGKLHDLVARIGISAASNMAKMVNHHGKLPIDYCPPVNYYDEEDIREGLLTLMAHCQILPLQSMITINPLLLAAYQARHPQLAANIWAACVMANHARAIIKVSSTHLSHDIFSSDYDWKIRQIRAKYDTPETQSAGGVSVEYVKRVAHYAAQSGLGNCLEYSCLSAMKLREVQSAEFSCEVFMIANGDHKFVLVGRNKESDPHDYRTWGESAVVGDSWLGEAYPANDIPDKLYDYCRYLNSNTRKGMNFLVRFNPFYHKLAPWSERIFSMPMECQSPQAQSSPACGRGRL